MAHSHFALRPPRLDYGPPCPGCGTAMCVACIEPTERPDYDLLTLECAWCEHKQRIVDKCNLTPSASGSASGQSRHFDDVRAVSALSETS